MNILFFLTPKSEVQYICNEDTLRQVLEKMEYHRYSAIPMLTKQGKYVGTITEGDLLWAIKEKYSLNLKEAEDIPISKIERKKDNAPVYANSNMEDLINKVMVQNFVPVLDDNKIFIGIITRRDVMNYLTTKLQKCKS